MALQTGIIGALAITSLSAATLPNPASEAAGSKWTGRQPISF